VGEDRGGGALDGADERAWRPKRPVAVAGYTPVRPISNSLLTLWGTIIVILTAG
jgi:hypothetical protein